MPTNIQPEKPNPNQESVWDYPRPPRVEPTAKRVRIVFHDIVIVDTTRALRVLETSHPPSYYLPQTDILMHYLQPTSRRTVCEFKGAASYWTLQIGERTVLNAAWSYRDPLPAYQAIQNHLAFYPSLMDACYVDEERVIAQSGDFYGGWITSDIVGPFKGGPGTWGW